jgi:hypothetical protein
MDPKGKNDSEMNLAKLNLHKITYLFRSGRLERIAAKNPGPTEFFYGYQQLLAKGYEVLALRDSDVGMAPPLSTFSSLANKLSPFLGGIPVGMTLSLLMRQGYLKLRDTDCVVATTNGMAISLAIAKAMNLVKPPILVLSMGLLPVNPNPLKLWLFSLFLRRVNIVCISRSEQASLQRLLPEKRIHYIPFGVDTDFWQSGNTKFSSEDYVLAIGNDPNRDWTTLVETWGPELPPLKIITSLPVPPGPPNVEIIRGDWRMRILDDIYIRKIYHGAMFVVIPLRNTNQPSGQSVCLQAMACSRPVILSDIDGLWDRKLLQNNENVLLVRPESVQALHAEVKRLISDPDLRDYIGAGGRRLVECHFNTGAMADSISLLLQDIVQL